MTVRRRLGRLSIARAWLLAAAVVVLAMPAVARAAETDISIESFTVTEDTTQAGAHPNVNIIMSFCGPGLAVTGASNTSPIVITTAQPHGLTAPTQVRVTEVRGNTAANAFTTADPVPGQPNELSLRGSTGNGNYAGGGRVLIATAFGCTLNQSAALLKDFTLRFPPGLLGNPTAVTPCPIAVWLVGGCPAGSQVGTAVADVVLTGGGLSIVPTKIFALETLGLEPARLGTEVLLGTPEGPFPNTIILRTANGDYGLNASQVNIPKDLGGNTGTIRGIDLFLCARAPCTEELRADPRTTKPLPGARPFFTNPTSCEPAQVTLEATSWAPGTLKSKSAAIQPTGCDTVPFDAKLDVAPTDTTDAAQPSGQTVTIDYCAHPSPGSCVNGRDSSDDEIWESALKVSDVTLPSGITLSPGGGVGLEACSFAQFGVDSSGTQVNNDAPTCPGGSQIGDVSAETPVLPDGSLAGKVFFGPITAPGRPTPAKPWKLFLYIEGAGLRIKLVGDVDLLPDGQVHTVFPKNPLVPLDRLDLRLRGGDRSVLANPEDCDTHVGNATLTGWADGKTSTSTPAMTPTACTPKAFGPVVDEATATPEQAGANSASRIVISRQDGEPDIKDLKLSLPAGAVGSIAAVPQCEISRAQAADCPEATKLGTVRTTVGTGSSLLAISGSLYLAQPRFPGDAATIALTVPAKVGPIELGNVVVLNRILLRPSDTGVDVVSDDIPSFLEGVRLHLRKIEITVDREGFFLNPTGCEPRPLTATTTPYGGGPAASSTVTLSSKGCDKLRFAPKLRLIAGAKGQNAQFAHPPLKAIVTQGPGEANIGTSQVVLPDLLRPNTPQFNVPGGLCSDAEFAQRACPAPSLAGSARVITPVLPFQLTGPAYMVQETGAVLPKIYVLLRGGGLEIVLRARNSFQGIRTVNTFENLPDVPQAYFELDIDGGQGGILNNFYDACFVSSKHLDFDYTFVGQNGAKRVAKARLEQGGCGPAAKLGAGISSNTVKAARNGVTKVRVRCRATERCRGRLSLRAQGVKAGKAFSIPAQKTKTSRLHFTKQELRSIRAARRLKARVTTKVPWVRNGKQAHKTITIVAPG